MKATRVYRRFVSVANRRQTADGDARCFAVRKVAAMLIVSIHNTLRDLKYLHINK